jgi:hypothetical protein
MKTGFRGFLVGICLLQSLCFLGCAVRDPGINLSWYVIQNDADLVERKLGQGALVNGKDKDEFSPLMIAAWTGNLGIVKMLIDSGANVNQLSKSGIPPILFATARGNFEVVEYLLAKGAKPDLAPEKQLNAIQISEKLGLAEIRGLFPIAGQSIGRIESDTARTTEDILSMVRIYLIQLKIIYDKNLHIRPGFKGKVTMKIAIDPDGNVPELAKVGSSTHFDEFDKSIASDIARWKFGKIRSKSNDVVSIPFTFDE